jgi:lipopolysaccharide export LptBFGC system permease protein LptF
MQGVELVQQRDDGSDLRKYNAALARWLDGRWWFEEGSVQEFDGQGNRTGPAETFEILEMRRLPEQPADFMADLKPAEYRSSLEQWTYIQANQHLSIETLTGEVVDFHKKLTEPVVCIIIILIGIPVGAHTGRKGAFAGIMLALGMFFAFYATQFFMVYLAKQMIIVPWLGPWGAVIAFLLIGLIMVHRMR